MHKLLQGYFEKRKNMKHPREAVYKSELTLTSSPKENTHGQTICWLEENSAESNNGCSLCKTGIRAVTDSKKLKRNLLSINNIIFCTDETL